VSEPRLLRVTTSAGLREKRLSALLEGRDPRDPRLRAAVEDAQVAGSLELAGIAATPREVALARGGGASAPEVQNLLRALRAAPPAAPLDVDRLRAWQAAATGGSGAWRTAERARAGGPPPAPARFVELRLRTLEQWLGVDSGRELTPCQQGALAMARIVEILPWDDGNGRVARLAASHLVVRAGARPPVLLGSDAGRLREALQAAFQLHTEPLCALLEEASERALDVMIAAVEAGVLGRAPD
jgi:Fic family protein